MDMPVVAGMEVDRKHPQPPAMAGVVAGAVISVLLWGAIVAVFVLIT
ncbi:MAG TPA: hypothetical protein VM900_06550 [Sphingomonas sp.]|jgi:hypothetical protein|nr:hypothetical protein [Sphingomonas sp.]